jgi:hypothetical protein
MNNFYVHFLKIDFIENEAEKMGANMMGGSGGMPGFGKIRF